jgi:hypothetical protein
VVRSRERGDAQQNPVNRLTDANDKVQIDMLVTTTVSCQARAQGLQTPQGLLVQGQLEVSTAMVTNPVVNLTSIYAVVTSRTAAWWRSSCRPRSASR